MSAKGLAHSIDLTYEPNTNLSSSLALWASEAARLDHLAKGSGPTAVSVKGASLTT